MLRYTDYKKPFDLMTDDPAYCTHAVLFQEGRPITMISRALKDSYWLWFKHWATHAIENCIVSLTATFCRLAAGSPCGRKDHAGGTAHCEIQLSNLDAITRVDDGITIISDRSTNVQVDNGTEILVHDTYLATSIYRAAIKSH